MAKGLSVHVGVATARSAARKPAHGCDLAAKRMYALAVERGFRATPALLNEEATLNNVRDALRAAFTDLDDGDLLFFSLAGHCMEKGDGGGGGDRHNQYFALADQWWKDDDVNALLGEITTRARVLVVADACDSGSIVTRFARWLKDDFARWHATDPWLESLHGSHCDTAMPIAQVTPQLRANVLLLAAAPLGRAARPSFYGHPYPIFTESLIHVVGTATSYLDLRNKACKYATSLGNPPPVLNIDLVTDRPFVDERPFTI